MGLTLLPGIIIIIFTHSLGLFLGKLLERLLKERAVALYAAQALRKPRLCSLPLSSTCAGQKNGELGTQGWFQMLERRQLEHTLTFLLLGICLKQIKKIVLSHPWHQDESSFEISKAYSKACPFHNFLKTTVENSFFAANRINNAIHKWSRISCSLIQLGANCQHKNFQLS